jgi:hypothetical protein
LASVRLQWRHMWSGYSSGWTASTTDRYLFDPAADFETFVFLWDRLQLPSNSASGLHQSLIHDHQNRREASMQTLPRRQCLEMLWSRIGDNASNERWARVLRRIH